MHFLKSNWMTISLLPLLITPAHATTAVADMAYANIISQGSQKCIDVLKSSQADGAPVAQMACAAKTASQVWKIVSITPTQYQIISNNTGMCLDVDGASQNNGANVQQSACAGINRKNQIWNLVPMNGGYQIISNNSNKCLDVTDWSTADGTILQQWDCNGAGQPNQTWKMSPAVPVLTSSPPLKITKSNTVISGVKITSTTGACITISGASGNVSNVTIQNSDIGPCGGGTAGNGILIQSQAGQGNVSNVIVNNVNFHDLQGSGISLVSGYRAAQTVGNSLSVTNSLFTNIAQFGIYISFVKPAMGDAVPAVPVLSFTNNKIQNIPNAGFLIYGANSAFVENNTFTKTQSGVSVQSSLGMRINNNNFSHIQPSKINGKFSYGNFVQFNKVTGNNNSISCNIGMQDDYNTVPKSSDGLTDEISVYESSGTASSPLLVVGNKLMGGGALQLTTGDEGSGITVGDGAGGSYINVIDNVLVNVGHGGLMGAGGNNIQFLNNIIFSVPNPANYFGMGFVNYAPLYHGGACSNITVKGNLVNWTNQWGPDKTGWINPLINGSTICTNFVWDSSNIFQDTKVTADIFNTYHPKECPLI
jgi:hypothetical protein